MYEYVTVQNDDDDLLLLNTATITAGRNATNLW